LENDLKSLPSGDMIIIDIEYKESHCREKPRGFSHPAFAGCDALWRFLCPKPGGAGDLAAMGQKLRFHQYRELQMCTYKPGFDEKGMNEMDNLFKRFLSLVLAVLMVVSYIPTSAFATEDGENQTPAEDVSQAEPASGEDTEVPEPDTEIPDTEDQGIEGLADNEDELPFVGAGEVDGGDINICDHSYVDDQCTLCEEITLCYSCAEPMVREWHDANCIDGAYYYLSCQSCGFYSEIIYSTVYTETNDSHEYDEYGWCALCSTCSVCPECGAVREGEWSMVQDCTKDLSYFYINCTNPDCGLSVNTGSTSGEIHEEHSFNENIRVPAVHPTCNAPGYYGYGCEYCAQYILSEETFGPPEGTGHHNFGADGICVNCGENKSEMAFFAIDDVTFNDFQSAIDAAEYDDTIQLLLDCYPGDADCAGMTALYVVAKDDKITLDLNGHTLAGRYAHSEDFAFLVNNGDLTIMDSTATHGSFGFGGGNPGETGVAGVASDTIVNYGTLTMESGLIGNGSNTGYDGHVVVNNSGAEFTVNGGSVEGPLTVMADSVFSIAKAGIWFRPYTASLDQYLAEGLTFGEVDEYGAACVVAGSSDPDAPGCTCESLCLGETGNADCSVCAEDKDACTALHPMCKEGMHALGPDFDKGFTEPTCVDDGEGWFKCSNKNCTFSEYSVLPANGLHDYNENGICTVCEAEDPTDFYAEVFATGGVFVLDTSVTVTRPLEVNADLTLKLSDGAWISLLTKDKGPHTEPVLKMNRGLLNVEFGSAAAEGRPCGIDGIFLNEGTIAFVSGDGNINTWQYTNSEGNTVECAIVNNSMVHFPEGQYWQVTNGEYWTTGVITEQEFATDCANGQHRTGVDKLRSIKPTCKDGGTRVDVCHFCTYTDTAVLPSNGLHDYNENGICTVCNTVDPTPAKLAQFAAGGWIELPESLYVTETLVVENDLSLALYENARLGLLGSGNVLKVNENVSLTIQGWGTNGVGGIENHGNLVISNVNLDGANTSTGSWHIQNYGNVNLYNGTYRELNIVNGEDATVTIFGGRYLFGDPANPQDIETIFAERGYVIAEGFVVGEKDVNGYTHVIPAPNHEAMIMGEEDTTFYTTLEDAIAAAMQNETDRVVQVLHNEITVEEPITIDVEGSIGILPATLDLVTITYTGTGAAVVLKNGRLWTDRIGVNTSGTYAYDIQGNGASLQLSNSAVLGTADAAIHVDKDVVSAQGNSIDLYNGCLLEADVALYLEGKGTNVNAYGGQWNTNSAAGALVVTNDNNFVLVGGTGVQNTAVDTENNAPWAFTLEGDSILVMDGGIGYPAGDIPYVGMASYTLSQTGAVARVNNRYYGSLETAMGDIGAFVDGMDDPANGQVSVLLLDDATVTGTLTAPESLGNLEINLNGHKVSTGADMAFDLNNPSIVIHGGEIQATQTCIQVGSSVNNLLLSGISTATTAEDGSGKAIVNYGSRIELESCHIGGDVSIATNAEAATLVRRNENVVLAGPIQLTYIGAALTADEELTVESGIAGYKAVYENGTYSLTMDDTVVTGPVAAIGSVEYTSLQAAIDAALSGNTITLIGGVGGSGIEEVPLDATVTVRADDNITIDLNGRSVMRGTGTWDQVEENAIHNLGTLTIVDSSEWARGSVSGILNEGTLTVNSGSVINPGIIIEFGEENNTYPGLSSDSPAVINKGTLILAGGQVSADEMGESNIAAAFVNEEGGSVILRGGLIFPNREYVRAEYLAEGYIFDSPDYAMRYEDFSGDMPVFIVKEQQEALDLRQVAAEGGTYKLTKDVIVVNPVDIIGELTLDLNGYELFCGYGQCSANYDSGAHKAWPTLNVAQSGVLTVVDTSETGNGTVWGIGNYGSLTVKSGMVMNYGFMETYWDEGSETEYTGFASRWPAIQGNGALSIEGGMIVADEYYNDGHPALAIQNNGKVSISGGMIFPQGNYLLDAYLAENCYYDHTEGQPDEGGNVPQYYGVWIRREDPSVAAIGSTKYETLQAAIDDSESGATITLLKDIFLEIDDFYSESVGIFVGLDRNITLDLNGHSLNGVRSSHVGMTKSLVSNYGTLTIVDSNRGEYNGINYAAGSPDNSETEGGGVNTIFNHGSLTINGAAVAGNMSAEAYTAYAIYTEGTVQILSGTIYGDTCVDGGGIEVTGGQVNGGFFVGEGSCAVTGGWFNRDVTAYLVPGYLQNDEGYVVVNEAAIDCEHTYGEEVHVIEASTCVTNGRGRRYCTKCNDFMDVGLELDPDNHEYGDDGVCTGCGDVAMTEEEKAIHEALTTDGGRYTVGRPVWLTEQVIIPEGVSVTLDLGMGTFGFNFDDERQTAAIVNYGTLTVVSDQDMGALRGIVNHGILNFQGGCIVHVAEEYALENYGTAKISGGNFVSFPVYNEGNLNITGGTFMEPVEPAQGYAALENQWGSYVVMPMAEDGTVEATNEVQLSAALYSAERVAVNQSIISRNGSYVVTYGRDITLILGENVTISNTSFNGMTEETTAVPAINVSGGAKLTIEAATEETVGSIAGISNRGTVILNSGSISPVRSDGTAVAAALTNYGSFTMNGGMLGAYGETGNAITMGNNASATIHAGVIAPNGAYLDAMIPYSSSVTVGDDGEVLVAKITDCVCRIECLTEEHKDAHCWFCAENWGECKALHPECSAGNHDLIPLEGYVEPTCVTAGGGWVKCNRDKCDYSTEQVLPAHGQHEYEDGICTLCSAQLHPDVNAAPEITVSQNVAAENVPEQVANEVIWDVENNEVAQTVSGMDSEKNASAVEQAGDSAKEALAEELNVPVDELPETTLVETKLSIELKVIQPSKENTSSISGLTFDVTPQVTVTVAEASTTETIKNLEAPITFRLPIPGYFESDVVNVFHEGSLLYANVHVWWERGSGYIEIASADFSEYSVKAVSYSAEEDSDIYVAEVNGEMFATLNAAVAAAQPGDTVMLLKDLVLESSLVIPDSVMVGHSHERVILADQNVTLTTAGYLNVVSGKTGYVVATANTDSGATVYSLKATNYVARVNDEFFTSLSDALAYARKGDVVQLLQSEITLEETAVLNLTGDVGIIAAAAEQVTITTNASTAIEIQAGHVWLDDITLVANGTYGIDLTGDTAGIQLSDTTIITGTADAAIHVAEGVNFVSEEIVDDPETDWTEEGITCNVQLYGATLEAKVPLYIEGNGSRAELWDATLCADSEAGAIYVSGDGNVILFGGRRIYNKQTVTVEERYEDATVQVVKPYALTVLGDSYVEMNGEICYVDADGATHAANMNQQLLAQTGVAARMANRYYGSFESAMAGLKETHFQDGHINVNLLKNVEIAQTVTVPETIYNLTLDLGEFTLTSRADKAIDIFSSEALIHNGIIEAPVTCVETASGVYNLWINGVTLRAATQNGNAKAIINNASYVGMGPVAIDANGIGIVNMVGCEFDMNDVGINAQTAIWNEADGMTLYVNQEEAPKPIALGNMEAHIYSYNDLTVVSGVAGYAAVHDTENGVYALEETDAVAMVGGTLYDTLAAAVAAAVEAKDTVQILQENVTLDATITVNTLEAVGILPIAGLSGYTITVAAGVETAFDVQSGGLWTDSMTLEGGKYGFKLSGATADLQLAGTTVKVSDAAIYVPEDVTYTPNLDEGENTSYSNIRLYGGNLEAATPIKILGNGFHAEAWGCSLRANSTEGILVVKGNDNRVFTDTEMTNAQVNAKNEPYAFTLSGDSVLELNGAIGYPVETGFEMTGNIGAILLNQTGAAAKVANRYYGSFDSALAGLQDFADAEWMNVTVLKDVEVANTTATPEGIQNLIFDLGGNTITATNQALVLNSQNVLIHNGKLVAGTTCIEANETVAKLEIMGISMTGNGKGIVTSTAELILDHVDISTTGTAIENNADSTISLTNYSGNSPVALRNTAANVTLTVANNNGYHPHNGKITLAAEDAALTADEALAVTSGVDGFMVKYENGTHKLVKVGAMIGDTPYESLQAAVTAAQTGDTIEMLADGGVVIVDVALTINRNGHTAKLYAGEDLTVKTYDDTYVVLPAEAVAENKGGKFAYVIGDESNLMYLQDALDAAAEQASQTGTAQTVRLTQNLTGENAPGTIIIPANVVLDIQSFTLEAERVIGLNGSKLTATPPNTDGENGGSLKVVSGNLVLAEDPIYDGTLAILPIWDPSQDCYMFSKFGFLTTPTEKAPTRGLTIDTEKEEIYFQFKHQATGYFNTGILKDGTSDNALKIIIRIEWKTDQGDAYQEFVYNDNQVGLVTGTSDYTFRLTQYSLVGVNLDSVKLTAMVVADSGATAQTKPFSVADAK